LFRLAARSLAGGEAGEALNSYNVDL